MSVGTWFRTDYDVPPSAAAVPLDLTSGKDPAITILDQVVRGTGIVGRVLGDFGAVAVKVRGTGRAVRVHVTVGLDDLATRWWADRVRPSRFAPELPRLVTIRAQGHIRGALVLARRQGFRGAGTADRTLSFDLTPDELDGDGLLIVELAEAHPPAWAAGRISRSSALGLRFNSIQVRDRTAPAGPAGPDEFTGCDFVVLQPGSGPAVRIGSAVAAQAPPLPLSPRNRVTRRKPVRAVFKASRMARRVAVRAMPHRHGALTGVRAADLLTGADVPVEVVGRRPDGLDVVLGAPVTGPVLLGASESRPGLSLRASAGGTS